MSTRPWLAIGICAALSASGALAAIPAFAQASSPPPSACPATPAAPTAKLTAADEQYLSGTTGTIEQELRLARLAQQHGSTALKQQAKKMVATSSKELEELQSMARAYGLTPAQGGVAEMQATATQLESLRGPDFDRAFAKALEDLRARDAQAARGELCNGQNAELRALADRRLTTPTGGAAIEK